MYWTDVLTAISECVGALAAVSIPFIIFHYEKKIKENNERHQQEILERYEKFEKEYGEKLKKLSKLVNENGDIVIDGGEYGNAKTKNVPAVFS